MGSTPLEVLNKRHVTPPSKATARTLRFLLRCMQAGADVTYTYSFDKAEMENKQVILLADHATRDAYKYVLYGYPLAAPNVVVGYQNIFVKGLFRLLLKGGIIPKKLYQADTKAILDMLKILRLGGSLCVFPEGIQSASGSTHPIFMGTAGLLKKAGVPVILCKSYGSYLVKPRYKKRANKGHQEFHYEILFREEDLKALSEAEICDRLIEHFRYDDFAWNRNARYPYTGAKREPLAKGIESILYHCPKCKSEFRLKTKGEAIVCEDCGNTVLLNEYYDLLPASERDSMPYSSIDAWFKHQRALAAEEAKQGFSYQYVCDMYDLHTEKLSFQPYYCCGEGQMTITNEVIRYQGTRHGEEVDISIPIKNAPSFVFTPNQDNDLYYKNIYYSFRPKKNRERVVKYMLLVEEAHRLLDVGWDKISRDAYDQSSTQG